MLTQVYNNYSLNFLGKSTPLTWFGIDINYFIAGGTILAAFVGILGAYIAWQIHKDSDRKRLTENKITKIEESITFLKCILEELNLNKAELVNIKTSILDIKKDLDDRNKKIFSYYDTKYCKEISSFYDGNTSYLMKLDNPKTIEYIIKSYNNLSKVYNLLRYVQNRTLETKDLLTLHLDKKSPSYQEFRNEALVEYKRQISERYKYTIDDINEIVKNDSTMFLFLVKELKVKLSELEKINPDSNIIKNSTLQIKNRA